MLFVILTIILVALLTYLSVKPLINNLFHSVPNEPKYIHSYVPLFGFGLQMYKDPIAFVRSLYLQHGKRFTIHMQSKRWTYFCDEQAYLTKVLKNPDMSIEEFFIDINVAGLDIRRECASNEGIQKEHLKQYHQYLVGAELEILNERVHDSLIRSMKNDVETLEQNANRVVNFFDLFGEFMLYAGSDGLFGQSFTSQQRNLAPSYYKLFQDYDLTVSYGVLRVPFKKFFYRSTYENRNRFVEKFSSLELNNGESKLVHAREELYRSDEYEHLFTKFDKGSHHASMVWAAVSNTAPMSCWSVVDLFLHPQALEAVKQELREHVPSPASIHKKEVLDKLKILESSINETIRRVLNINSTRQAIVDTTIECSDKTQIGVRKGDMVLYPAFLKHLDPDLFGPEPHAHQYDRFVKKAGQPKAPSVMIFGCGVHMCPGRYWAINEIKILVALLVQHMEIEFVNITDEDRNEYRKKLPYDYSKVVSAGGPKKGYEHKFDIKYSYKNLNEL